MKKEIFIPVLLVIYLIVMLVKGYPSLQSGVVSPLSYFGGAALALACIVMLHFNLRRTAARRRQNRSDEGEEASAGKK